MRYYISSCVFTSQFPELSSRIQGFVKERYDLNIIRCCVPRYKIKDFEGRMPEGPLRVKWASMPDSGEFKAGDEVYSLCHNCNNIIEEMHPGVEVHSLWEFLDSDKNLRLPIYEDLTVTIQDCWRSRDRSDEQKAVRSLLNKMHIDYIEADKNHQNTDFCGVSLYRPQPPRNPKLAPKHYVEGAEGLFIPHTPEEQERIMKDYCSGYKTPTIVCYCHYCLEGIKLGGMDGRHIAELIFDGACRDYYRTILDTER